MDEVKPTVVQGVACPLDAVLRGSGERVAQLVDDVARFAAVEDLFHQRLDRYGMATLTETRKFNYVASITEPEPGYLEVSEYRAEKLTLAGTTTSRAPVSRRWRSFFIRMCKITSR